MVALALSPAAVKAQRFPYLRPIPSSSFEKERKLLSPAQAAVIVHGDLSKYGEADRLYLRYFYQPHLDPLYRFKLARVLSGHANGMSSEPELKAPLPVDREGAVLRIDLRWYGWNAKTWEKLPDPYSLAPAAEYPKRIHKAGVPWTDGKRYAYDFEYLDKTATASLMAPHLALSPSSPNIVEDLYAWTGSRVPMVRGDWFLSQTATQEGKNPGYYDFSGIEDEKTFEKLVRFDPKLADKTEHYRAAIFSGITNQPRRVSRKNSTLGGYRESFDNEKAVGLKNPLVILDDTFQFDITEKYAPRLNGMPAWYLGDNKGKRADKALDNIVGGDLFGIQYAPPGTRVHDTRLQVNLSCISCHFASLDENGVKGGSLAVIRKITEPNYEVFLDLTRKYLRDLELPTKQDRLGYLYAVKGCTGWEPAEYAVEYRTAHGLYEFGRINLKIAANEMGVSPTELGVKLAGYDLATGNKLHPLLSMLRDGGEIPRRQWEEVFPEANRVYYSVNLIPKEGK